MATRVFLKWYEIRSSARTAMIRFLRNERGDAIQNVMIAAIAAVILLALLVFGRKGLKQLDSFWNEAK